MANFILANQTTQREQDVDRLFRRVLACILLGNNDAHAKNFGLLYTEEGFRLAPFYDIVAAALYDRFKGEQEQMASIAQVLLSTDRLKEYWPVQFGKVQSEKTLNR